MTRNVVPLGVKLWVGVTVVVALASTLLFYELSGRERAKLVDAKVKASLMVADILAAALAAPLDFEDDDATRTELEYARANPEVLWAGVFGKTSQKLIASTGTDGEHLAPSVAPTEDGPTLGERAVVIAKKVRGRDQKEIGTAVMVVTLEPENRAVSESRSSILRLCLLLALGTATVLAFVIHLQVARPLGRLSAAARKLEEGRTDVRVAVSSRDEVGALATSFNAMTSAVVDRETKLAEARRAVEELLDNMRQAIVVFDPSGIIVGVQSRAAHALFERDELSGARVAELLYGEAEAWEVERQAFESWLGLAGSIDPEDWPDVVDLAPREVTRGEGEGARVLELEFQPLEGADDDGEGRRIMLLALDVTRERRLKEARDRQSEEVAGLRKLIDGGAHVFAAFLRSATDRVERCAGLVRSEPFDRDAQVEIMRHVHTLKGEATVYQLVRLVDASREAEELLGVSSFTKGDVPAIVDALSRVGQEIEGEERRLIALAGPDALAKVPVDQGALDRLVSLTRDRDDDVARVVRELSGRPFGELVGTLVERVPAWAEGAGKKARLTISGESELVPQELGRALTGAIVHLVRNAVAHGIEKPEARSQSQKPETGTVKLTCSSERAGPRITIEDDGVGLDAAHGERIFEAGFTTKGGADELSGRGFGLFAVRRELERVHYDVAVVQQSGLGAAFVLRPTVQSAAPAGAPNGH